MNIQVTRKKLSITNKSKGLQYVREFIVKGKKTMVNLLKELNKLCGHIISPSFRSKSKNRGSFGVLNDDDK